MWEASATSAGWEKEYCDNIIIIISGVSGKKRCGRGKGSSSAPPEALLHMVVSEYWIITKVNTMECRSPFLIPCGTEHTLRQKSAFTSSFLGRFKLIQISGKLDSCHLYLEFLREEMHPVWLGYLHITALQAHTCAHTHTHHWDLAQPCTIWSTVQTEIK